MPSWMVGKVLRVAWRNFRCLRPPFRDLNRRSCRCWGATGRGVAQLSREGATDCRGQGREISCSQGTGLREKATNVRWIRRGTSPAFMCSL